MKLRVNILCILGAVLGIASVFSVWVVYHQVDIYAVVESTPYTGIDLLGPYARSPMDVSILAPLLLVVGTVIAFISPTGGILQVAGTLYFLSWVRLHLNPGHMFFGWYVDWSYGPFIGLAAGALVILSIFHPIGPNCKERPRGVLDRLVSISRMK
jgi:hypothetical protein